MSEETNKEKTKANSGGGLTDFVKDFAGRGGVEPYEISLTSPKQTFTTSRELIRQQTRKKPIQGNLFDMLTPKARDQAIVLSETDGLLSQVTDGINAGVLGTKVIIGLAQTLYLQSEMYGNTDRLLGMSEEVTKATGIELSEGELGTRKDPKKPVISPSPYVYIKTHDFTKLVQGTERVGGKDIKAVKDMLFDLHNKMIYIDRGDGNFIGRRLLTIEGTDIDTKTGAEVLLLQLKPIFTRAIASDFVTIRKDTLKVLSGRQKDITMKLFLYLVEQHSYKNLPTYPTIKITKAELFSRIAVIKSYEKYSKRREPDFQEAVNRMKALHLIHSYNEEYGAGGDIICIFHLNKAYTSEPMTAEKQIGQRNPKPSSAQESGADIIDVEGEEVL